MRPSIQGSSPSVAVKSALRGKQHVASLTTASSLRNRPQEAGAVLLLQRRGNVPVGRSVRRPPPHHLLERLLRAQIAHDRRLPPDPSHAPPASTCRQGRAAAPGRHPSGAARDQTSGPRSRSARCRPDPRSSRRSSPPPAHSGCPSSRPRPSGSAAAAGRREVGERPEDPQTSSGSPSSVAMIVSGALPSTLSQAMLTRLSSPLSSRSRASSISACERGRLTHCSTRPVSLPYRS